MSEQRTTRYLPIVAVVPEHAAARIWAIADDAVRQDHLPRELRELMDQNGWTTEAVVAGMMIVEGVREARGDE